MTENKRFTDIEHDFENARIKCKDNGMFMLYAIYENDDGLPTLGDLLNNQEETIQELLQYKYLVKALEEINKTYIEELISDWTDGAYSDKEEQLQLGKYHSENGLSWEDKE